MLWKEYCSSQYRLLTFMSKTSYTLIVFPGITTLVSVLGNDDRLPIVILESA